MFFSDERQNATYSQFIGEVVSTDGGNTWSATPDGSTNFGPGEIKVVASGSQADRPGMPTVAQLGAGGAFVMSYELCGPHSCAVHTKTSADADNWSPDPSDVGALAETSDGLSLKVSPVIIWVANGGQDGTLYLTAHREVSATGSVPANQTVVLVNKNSASGPSGSWSWIPVPAIPTAGASGSCNTNYSPELMPSADNTSLLYSAAGVVGNYNCEEVTHPIPIAP